MEKLLRDALEHIMKTCGQSRTQTRRLRWIAKRAELALAGRPYVAAEHDLPISADSEHFKLLRRDHRHRERIAELESERFKLPDPIDINAQPGYGHIPYSEGWNDCIEKAKEISQ